MNQKALDTHRPIVITGGHMTPAIAVLQELRRRGYSRFIWAGQKYNQMGATSVSPEYKTVTEVEQVKFIPIVTGKLVRSWKQSLSEFFSAVYNLAKIPIGFLQATWMMSRHRPALIVSFGGFLAIPVVIMGRIFGAKVITHEQTVVTGMANKVIAKFANTVLLSWESSQNFYSNHPNVHVTGNPIRRGVSEIRSMNIEFQDDLPIIYITGGNQGASTVNRVVFSCLPQLLKISNVIHQTGSAEKTTKLLEHLSLPEELKHRYVRKAFFFEDELGEILDKSSLVVSRAGANTVTELLALAKPSILIPIPWVSGNEQQLNAEMVAKAGLAKIITQAELTDDNLLLSIQDWLASIKEQQSIDGRPLSKVCAQAQHMVNINAAVSIADAIEDLL